MQQWDRPAATVSGAAALGELLGTSEAAAVLAAVAMPAAAGRIARAAPEGGAWEPAEAAPPDAGPWDRAHDWTGPTLTVPYICPGLALGPALGKITLIAGQPGVGKGPIADHLAVCLSLGLPAFGRFALERTRVLLADFEGVALTARRCRRMAAAMGHDPEALTDWLRLVDCGAVLDPTDLDSMAELADAVERYQIGAVVVDSYTSAMACTGVEANAPAYALFARLLGQLGVTVIAVAHSNKAADDRATPKLADVAYTGALVALAQTALVVQRGDTPDAVRLTCARAPEGTFPPVPLVFHDDEPTGGLAIDVAPPAAAVAPAGRPAPADRAVLTRAVATIAAGRRIVARLEGVDGHCSRRELCACAGEARSVAERALALLTDAGLIGLCAGAYALTADGRAADDRAVGDALGRVGQFARG